MPCPSCQDPKWPTSSRCKAETCRRCRSGQAALLYSYATRTPEKLAARAENVRKARAPFKKRCPEGGLHEDTLKRDTGELVCSKCLRIRE